MTARSDKAARIVKAVHARRKMKPDPRFELELSAWMRKTMDREALLALYGRHSAGETAFDGMMRRAVIRSIARAFGHGVTIAPGVGFKHAETFEIGDGVFIGAQSYLQGRFDGRCVLGRHVWIGPQSYMDARDLRIGEYAGWGPGAKIIGSEHTGEPVTVPVLQTDLAIRPVRIGPWADIGANAVVLPGVRVGKGALVGAGAVVTRDVPPFTVAAGIPARVLRRRTDLTKGKAG